MNNLRQTFWNKRIPPFLGIFALLLSVTTIIWLSSNAISLNSKAAEGGTPKNVQISNITDSSFTISYTTDDAVTGLISYRKDEVAPTPAEGESEEEKPDQVVFDDRDKQKGEALPYRVHYITVQQLEPGTKYFYSITSGDEEFQTEEDLPFEITTAPTIQDTPKTLSPIKGKVTLYDNAIPTEAIAYVSSEKSQLLSVFLKPDGTYELPLTGMREEELEHYFPLAADTKLKMLIINSSLRSNITILAGQAESPIPQVILPKDYDFALNAPISAPTPKDDSTPSSSSATLTPPAFPTTSVASSSSLTIITPKEDQEFKDPQPTFKGGALPNTTVDIVINSGVAIEASIDADANGNWEFRPPTPLESGVHTITVSARDAMGTMQTVNRSFTVFASGSQFIEPSVKVATPTTAPTAIPTPTTEPTATPTTAPTAGQSPSPTASNDNSSQLTPSTTEPRPSIAPTGSATAIVGFTAIMISLIIGGILLFAL